MEDDYPPIDESIDSGLSQRPRDDKVKESGDGNELNAFYTELRRQRSAERKQLLRGARIADKRKRNRLKRKKRKSKGK